MKVEDYFLLKLREHADMIVSIFMPEAKKQMDKFRAKSQIKGTSRFAHYTSAENALKIIKSKRLWMRNTNCMSDYSEIQHGFEILDEWFFNQTNSNNFKSALNSIHADVADAGIQAFYSNFEKIRMNTYVSSLSEHYEKEDKHGRLSMWRAFGNSNASVAIIMNLPDYSPGPRKLGLFFSPVAYLCKDKLSDVLSKIIKNINSNKVFLNTCSRDEITQYVYATLIAAVTCLKHEGFYEEQEWRAVYCPGIRETDLMKNELEAVTIRDIPQIIHKIPLDKTIDSSLDDLDFCKVFDRIIIGPTSYPLPVKQALCYSLEAIGIANPESKIHISGIPIR